MFLTANHINFKYGSGKTVLDDISFTLDKGKTLAILGASGSGKSTLLRIISGVISAGNSSLDGTVSIDDQTCDEYRKTGKLSFMFQEPTLLPNLNVLQNIALPLKISGATETQQVSRLMDMVGLSTYANFLPKELSGGMKTRVALARSFVAGPQLLLLDEPFSALDIAWKSHLYRELEKLRQQQDSTMVIVTHDVQEALLLADQVLVLNGLGADEHACDIVTSYSKADRVTHISAYMNSVYETYMSPLQDYIINGQQKK